MIVLAQHANTARCESSMSSCNESKQHPLAPKSARVISFSPDVLVHPIIHIDEFEDIELNCCWYSSDEFDGMKQDIRYTINMARRGFELDDDLLCERGLEHRIDVEAAAHRQQRSREAREFVLAEQQSTVIALLTSDYEVASVYNQLSYRGKMTAYLIGVNDAKTARSICSKRLDSVFTSGSILGIAEIQFYE